MEDATEAQRFPHCFGCGSENPFGLKLAFELADGKLSAEFTPMEHHQGWPGIVHGGIISSLLYEVMENWPYMNGTVTMMRSMDTRLRRPASTSRSITATSWLESREGREMVVAARLECDGSTVADGRASLVVLDERQRARLGL